MSEIRKLPKKPTTQQQIKVSRMRSRLGKQVKDFLHAASSFLPNLEDTDLNPFDEELINTPSDESVEPEDVVDGSPEDDSLYEEEDESNTPLDLPEAVVLPLPSNITSTRLKPMLESVISVERELRKGQANTL